MLTWTPCPFLQKLPGARIIHYMLASTPPLKPHSGTTQENRTMINMSSIKTSYRSLCISHIPDSFSFVPPDNGVGLFIVSLGLSTVETQV